MKQINASEVMKLRQKTGLPMMECKAALTEADGDEERAIEILRRRGLSRVEERAERRASAGIIESYSHNGRIGVLVELLAETDFVAGSEEFKSLAHNIALQIAAMNPLFLSKESLPPEILKREQKVFAEQAKAENKPEVVAEKIIAGKLEKFYAEVCLLNQPFIKDQNITVADLITAAAAKIGEKIVLSRFIRYELAG